MIAIAHAVFWLSALLLTYVFAGYPLCIGWLARVLPQPVCKLASTSTVTIVIAVHEGAALIHAKLVNLLALDYPQEKFDIIIVCDGCWDDTAAQCRQFSNPRIRVLEYAERRGKAACLNDGIAVATGEILLMTDVRQKLDPKALSELVANLSDPTVGAVSGELQMLDAQTGFALGVDAYWRYEKMMRHAESRAGSTVGVTGALYAMRRELFRPIPSDTVLDDVLIPMRIAAMGRRVVFEPQALAWDRPSQQPAEERRRKIRTLAGNYQLVQLDPWLLLPWRNPLWWRFVSHKLLRLMAPWLLVLLTLASAVLAPRHAIYALTLMLLIGGAILAALGRWLPALGRMMPVRLAVAFCYLNLFAAQGLIAFARNRRLHLW